MSRSYKVERVIIELPSGYFAALTAEGSRNVTADGSCWNGVIGNSGEDAAAILDARADLFGAQS